MSTVTLLRELWRLKRSVAVAALVAVATAILMMYRVSFPPALESRHHQVGLASASALVDTPSSQVVDLGGKDSTAAPMLPGRAALLASLVTTSPLKDEIAHRAGIDPRTLITNGPSAGATAGAATEQPLTTGVTIKPDDPHASVLTLETDTTLPILTVNVEAPDVATATRLANGTVQTLQAHLASVAGAQAVPEKRRVVVKQLGPARFGVSTRGPSRMIALVAAFFVFLVGCSIPLFGVRLFREWRRSEELDRLAIAWDDEPQPEVARSGVRW